MKIMLKKTSIIKFPYNQQNSPQFFEVHKQIKLKSKSEKIINRLRVAD